MPIDPKEDKSLWEKQELEKVGTVLLVEESYYDGIVELLEKKTKEIQFLYGRLNIIGEYIDQGRDLCRHFNS